MRARVRLLAGSGILLTMIGIGACERASTVMSPPRAQADAATASTPGTRAVPFDSLTGVALAQLGHRSGATAPLPEGIGRARAGSVIRSAESVAGGPTATLLTFEDLPDGDWNMGFNNPYHGALFSTSWMACTLMAGTDPEYGQAHSGQHYLFNGYACDRQWFAFGAPVYFGGAWVATSAIVLYPTRELWFEGYRHGVLVGESPHQTLAAGPMKYLAAGFPGVVDSVVIRRTKADLWSYGAMWLMDDVCFGTAPVTADCAVAANSAPTASVGGPYTGQEGAALAVQLGGSDAGGDALTYTWDFGDGGTGTGTTPPSSHVYADNGVYTITLTASDGHGGADTRSTTASIVNLAPSVSASGPTQIYSGQSAAFTGSFSDAGSQDAPWQYAFDWGTGSPSTGQTATQGTVSSGFTYFTAGRHTVRLTVTDKDGGAGYGTAAITVLRLPLSVDIKPGSSDNPVNLMAAGDGSLAVAVLSSASFDASTVDVASVTLGSAAGGAGVERRKNGAYQASLADANGDGRADLVLHFDRQALIAGGWLDANTTALTLLGNLRSGVQVAATDAVKPVR